MSESENHIFLIITLHPCRLQHFIFFSVSDPLHRLFPLTRMPSPNLFAGKLQLIVEDPILTSSVIFLDRPKPMSHLCPHFSFWIIPFLIIHQLHCHYRCASIYTLYQVGGPSRSKPCCIWLWILVPSQGPHTRMASGGICWTNHKKWILLMLFSVSFCYITCHPQTSWLGTSLISSWLVGWAILVWPGLADLCLVGLHIHSQLMGQPEVR